MARQVQRGLRREPGSRPVRGRRPILAWHGTHLYPDGSLLLNFEGQLFPFGGGLVKLDKDLRVVWKLARNTHHAVTVAEDGTIWVPSLNYQAQGMAELPGFEPWFYEDTILKVSPDGSSRRDLGPARHALAARAAAAAQRDLRSDAPQRHRTGHAELAAAFPMLKVGRPAGLLRNVSSLVAIDAETKMARWAMAGSFRRQHDPDLLPNGHILVFDNLGGDPACGRSRILELDPVTQAIVWSYAGCNGDRFYSEAWGEQQLLPNGNVLLVTESYGGRVP